MSCVSWLICLGLFRGWELYEQLSNPGRHFSTNQLITFFCIGASGTGYMAWILTLMKWMRVLPLGSRDQNFIFYCQGQRLIRLKAMWTAEKIKYLLAVTWCLLKTKQQLASTGSFGSVFQPDKILPEFNGKCVQIGNVFPKAQGLNAAEPDAGIWGEIPGAKIFVCSLGAPLFWGWCTHSNKEVTPS